MRHRQQSNRLLPHSMLRSNSNNMENSSYSGTDENGMSVASTSGLIGHQPSPSLAPDSKLIAFQRAANVASHFLALAAVINVIVWINQLGGLSWEQGQSKLVFNWHPLCMILAFAFMTVAALTFRQHRLISERRTRKAFHAIGWAIATLSALIALIAVFKSHNDAASGYIANLYSLHSWIGIGVIGMYVLQFVLGTYTFYWAQNNSSAAFKATVLVWHKVAGPLLYNLVGATILLGIQEKEGFINCSYKVDKVDSFPLEHFGEIPQVCKTSHLLGILVLAMLLSTNIALYNFPKATAVVAPTAEETQHIL
mmetsp:Transcript_52540/g.78501  ORF Transcript_52540/g.78501 Transcript_52540/m.78501 type:complete len:310 (-) Transcript_52540:308-1237(-)